MKVTIDPASGFCFGVKRAIEQAETLLDKGGRLYCLGDIVHNRAEMNRLQKRGLVSVGHEELVNLAGERLLFRAHGEPPASYRAIEKNSISLADATCPIVKKLQERITKAWQGIKKDNGQLVIFGNPDHPETIGLLGQTGGEAIVVTAPEDLSEIDPRRPVVLFSQTTKNSSDFSQLEKNISEMMGKYYREDELPLKVHNTICGQISGRIPRIRKFAAEHDVVVFVGGTQSSNARVLFGHCREVNPGSRFVTKPEEVQAEWFAGAGSAGVCGAASTPQWLMEKVADNIRMLTDKNQ